MNRIETAIEYVVVIGWLCAGILACTTLGCAVDADYATAKAERATRMAARVAAAVPDGPAVPPAVPGDVTGN